MDRLLTTAQAGELLGGKHPKDVIALIRKGALKAKLINVRGTSANAKPHLYVRESELERFIRELPDAEADPPLSERPERPAGRKPRRGRLKNVIEFA